MFAMATTLLWVLPLSGALLVVRMLRASLDRHRFSEEARCKPPCAEAPVKDPFVGIDFVFDTFFGQNVPRYIADCHDGFRKFGSTYTVRRWTWQVIYTCDSSNLKHILTTRFSDFVLPDIRIRAMSPLLGAGIFTLNGPSWSRARTALRSMLQQQKLDDRLDLLEKHFQKNFSQLPKNGVSVDIQPLFFQFAMDVATDFFLGRACQDKFTSEDPSSDKRQFVIDYLLCSEEIIRKMRLGPLQWILSSVETRRAKKRIFRYIDEYISEALGRRDASDEEKAPEALSSLFELTNDKTALRDQVLHILLASRDTTASLLSNLYFMLARNPKIYQKLRGEVINRVGTRTPTAAELKEIPYLRWCVNESLRLHPVIPSNAREAHVDTTLPLGGGHDGQSPLFVKKGTLIVYNVYSMHRDSQVFGDHVDDFVPERWASIRPGWSFLPFNGGPRVCIGQQFALVETYYATARLLQTFEVLESRDEREWCEKDGLAMTCLNGVHVAVHEARASSRAGAFEL